MPAVLPPADALLTAARELGIGISAPVVGRICTASGRRGEKA